MPLGRFMNPITALRTLNTAQKNDRASIEAHRAATRGSGKPLETEGESTWIGEALMKLSRYADTAAQMSERDMRVQLADIADRLLALAQGGAIREHQHA